MWKTLKDLYQNSSNQRKLALKDKLRRIKMENGDTLSTYLNKLTTWKYELSSVGITTVDDDMKKSKKGSSEGSEGGPLASQFDMDYTLITCMVSSMMGCGWFLDSKASFHMTGDKSLFSTLEEKDLKMCIEMDDDERYSVSGVGTVAFQREHGALITMTDVKYVPRLKKNLVSITMLEDKGYDVVFSKGKVFLRHITMGQVKQIDSRVKNLYAL
eukprot:PITA_13713